MKQVIHTVGHSLGLVLVLFLLSSTALRAQVANGVITGRLTDVTGAIIPNAQVMLTKTDTSLTVKTNASGIYSFPSL